MGVIPETSFKPQLPSLPPSLPLYLSTMGDACRLIALVFALFFPPVSVFLVKGCGCDLLINLLLTCAFFIPGMIHAFWCVLKEATLQISRTMLQPNIHFKYLFLCFILSLFEIF